MPRAGYEGLKLGMQKLLYECLPGIDSYGGLCSILILSVLQRATMNLIKHDINGIVVQQRRADGYINGTAMCATHNKDISDWLRANETLELAGALAEDLGIKSNPVKSPNSLKTRVSASYPTLVIVKRGAPDSGGGVWLHPDLAISLAQWCSPKFAIQVSKWVREWMTTGKAPTANEILAQYNQDRSRQFQSDASRADMRKQLAGYRKKLNATISNHFQQIGDRTDRSIYPRIADAINQAITTETAQQMRKRTKLESSKLIADYTPEEQLRWYGQVVIVTTQLIIRQKMHPLAAVAESPLIALPSDFKPEAIEPVDPVKAAEKRIIGYLSGQLALPWR